MKLLFIRGNINHELLLLRDYLMPSEDRIASDSSRLMWDGRTYGTTPTWTYSKERDGSFLIYAQKGNRYNVIFITGILVVLLASMAGIMVYYFALSVVLSSVPMILTVIFFYWHHLSSQKRAFRQEETFQERIILRVNPNGTVELPRHQVTLPSESKIVIQVVCDYSPQQYDDGVDEEEDAPYTELNLLVESEDGEQFLAYGLVGDQAFGPASRKKICNNSFSSYGAKKLAKVTGCPIVRVPVSK